MKNRWINTHFWDDEYITKLEPQEKLLFLYAISNPLTNLCGIYEITIRRISFDTGIKQDSVEKTLVRFEADGRMRFDGKFLAIRNFMEHQNYNSNMKIAVDHELALIPDDVKNWTSRHERFGMVPNGSEPSIYISKSNRIKYNKIESNIDKCNNNTIINDKKQLLIEIIEYLNNIAGTNFRHNIHKTGALIAARIKEGFTLDDFKAVIDRKHKQWYGTDMAKYLRPETLFGTKFEGYLNESDAVKTCSKSRTAVEECARAAAEIKRKQEAGL